MGLLCLQLYSRFVILCIDNSLVNNLLKTLNLNNKTNGSWVTINAGPNFVFSSEYRESELGVYAEVEINIR